MVQSLSMQLLTSQKLPLDSDFVTEVFEYTVMALTITESSGGSQVAGPFFIIEVKNQCW